MDPEAERAITPELGAGERLLWLGRPGAGMTFHFFDIYATLFGVIWTVFAFIAYWQDRRPDRMPLPLAVAMMGFGLYLTFGRFLAYAYLRRKISYGVTNERIIIKSEIFRSRVRSLNLRTLVEVALTERSDGRGTISFGGAHWDWRARGGDFWAPGTYNMNVFERIPDARQVYQQIRAAQRSAP